jgi:electron transport complex protein RnfE
VASLVTVVQFLMQGFLPDLYESLGIYIPLIVVNCIILGRAESYASKNGPVLSIFDGIGMGLGFTWALLMLGLVREILGSGQAFGVQILPLADAATGKIGFTPITIFVLAPGAFLVLAILIAIMNVIRAKAEAKGKPLPEPTGCLAGDCDGCSGCPAGSVGTKVITAGEDTPALEKNE